jgi:hypothetical protein
MQILWNTNEVRYVINSITFDPRTKMNVEWFKPIEWFKKVWSSKGPTLKAVEHHGQYKDLPGLRSACARAVRSGIWRGRQSTCLSMKACLQRGMDYRRRKESWWGGVGETLNWIIFSILSCETYLPIPDKRSLRLRLWTRLGWPICVDIVPTLWSIPHRRARGLIFKLWLSSIVANPARR